MKTLFNKFIKDQGITKEELKTMVQPAAFNMLLSELTSKFSKWISGYVDEQKKTKRFQSTYRVNKFMVRKWINKLAVA